MTIPRCIYPFHCCHLGCSQSRASTVCCHDLTYTALQCLCARISLDNQEWNYWSMEYKYQQLNQIDAKIYSQVMAPLHTDQQPATFTIVLHLRQNLVLINVFSFWRLFIGISLQCKFAFFQLLRRLSTSFLATQISSSLKDLFTPFVFFKISGYLALIF